MTVHDYFNELKEDGGLPKTGSSLFPAISMMTTPHGLPRRAVVDDQQTHFQFGINWDTGRFSLTETGELPRACVTRLKRG